MHDKIAAALKARHKAEEEYLGVVANVEGQYLRSLESSHDGSNAECKDILAQIKSVRAKYLKPGVAAPVAEPVKARFDADASGDKPAAAKSKKK
jgi:DNA-binding FrmR family transcriptional regulator